MRNDLRAPPHPDSELGQLLEEIRIKANTRAISSEDSRDRPGEIRRRLQQQRREVHTNALKTFAELQSQKNEREQEEAGDRKHLLDLLERDVTERKRLSDAIIEYLRAHNKK